MSNEPLLPSYGAATQRHRSSEYRLVAKHTHDTPTLVDVLSLFIFLISAVFSTIWATQSSTVASGHPGTPPHTGSAPLLPYFASISLVISTCFWLGYLFFIANDGHGGSVLKRKITIGAAVVGKIVLAAAHVAIWQAYKMWYAGLVTPNWMVVFVAAQAWFDVVFVGVNGWAL
ncbi:uncharacterized protein ALTATR162_LOCUS10300 [Alternaria atra]|uniref:Uncharacterized protein n=1 Tax=Alternaria atra TaxID=119953 RepID=A0A8J2I8V4_9PLEO|nr:uncharacterized protein ALTATR162_LOCUS10300 [Alternaria atra]CAG5182718.1 unnamed protein product [Alternaria atra]